MNEIPKLEQVETCAKCRYECTCNHDGWTKPSVRAQHKALAKLLKYCACGCETINHDEAGDCNSCSLEECDKWQCPDSIIERYNKVLRVLEGKE